jgi:tRNA(Ser,Leu) C12 N-acetylase TAN1
MNIALQTNAPATRAERSRALESDVAMIRMQGLEPVPEFFSIAERYVAGELTLDQFSAEVDRLGEKRQKSGFGQRFVVRQARRRARNISSRFFTATGWPDKSF